MKVINKYIELCLEFAKPWCVFLSSFRVFLSSKIMQKLAENNYRGGGNPPSL